jgi:hypothetical protein
MKLAKESKGFSTHIIVNVFNLRSEGATDYEYCKSKGKFRPRTGHEGPEVYRCIAVLSL